MGRMDTRYAEKANPWSHSLPDGVDGDVPIEGVHQIRSGLRGEEMGQGTDLGLAEFGEFIGATGRIVHHV